MNRWALLLTTLFRLVEKRIGGVQRLVALFVVALSITLFLSNGAWAGVLFQSPVSPLPDEVAPAQSEPFAPEEEPEDPFAPSPADPQEPEDPFAPSEAQEQPAEDLPVDTIEEPPVEVEPDPLDDAVDPDQPIPEAASPVSPEQQTDDESSALDVPVEAPRSVRLERSDDLAEAGGDRILTLDQAELIDTVVVSTAYIWLCCGIGLFLLIPLAFLFLQIRGRTKIAREEIY